MLYLLYGHTLCHITHPQNKFTLVGSKILLFFEKLKYIDEIFPNSLTASDSSLRLSSVSYKLQGFFTAAPENHNNLVRL